METDTIWPQMKQTTAVSESLAPMNNEVAFTDIDQFSSETRDKEIEMFNPTQSGDFVPMEGVADFPVDIHNFLAAPGIPDCPPIYEPL